MRLHHGSRMIDESSQKPTDRIDLVPTVYIVTASRTLRESLQSLVSGLRYSAKSFPDAESFLRQFRPRTHQVLLLDLDIPGMGGLALLEKLRDMSAELPVITIGDSYDVTSAVGAMQRGAVDFFEKPFVDNVLVSRIEETIH